MDEYSVMAFIQDGLSIVCLIGFCAGFLISSVVMGIRAVTTVFRKIVR